MNYKVAIFDLDGTLLNTLEDMKDALNLGMSTYGHKHDFTADTVKPFYGSGVNMAVRRALCCEAGYTTEELYAVKTRQDRLPDGITDELVSQIEAVYMPYYKVHNMDHTAPYEGIEEMLEKLADAGVVLAVLSNKTDRDVQTLIKAKFPGVFQVILGEKESEGIRRKPAPDMCNKVLEMLGADRADAVYIGDSEIDYETAVNAEMDIIAVNWGFRSTEYLKGLGARKIASTPEDIYTMICG